MDRHSEFPEESGWSYTELLFPRAYREGFQFAQETSLFWQLITTRISASELKKGLPMEVVAAFIANVCILCKTKDEKGFRIPADIAEKALQCALAGEPL